MQTAIQNKAETPSTGIGSASQRLNRLAKLDYLDGRLFLRSPFVWIAQRVRSLRSENTFNKLASRWGLRQKREMRLHVDIMVQQKDARQQGDSPAL